MLIGARIGRLTDALSGEMLDAADIERAVADRAALFAQLGLREGGRVLIHYGNCPAFFVDLLAIWRCAGCAVPLDSRAGAAEVGNVAALTRPVLSLWNTAPASDITTVLARTQSRIVSVTDRRTGPSTAPASPWKLDDDALILFTSGTTGQPKGVVHTHRTLQARWIALHGALGLGDFERTLCLLPTHFGHGLICNCLYPWLSGQDLFILPPFRTDLMLGLGEIIDRHRITFMSSVPPVWRIALKMTRPPASGSLRKVFCGSAPLTHHLWTSIHGWTAGAEIGNAYGITETGSWIGGSANLGLSPEDGLIGRGWGSVFSVRRRGDTTTPVADSDQCAPGEQGYIWVNTPGLMRGYLARDDLTSQVVAEGWFSTGDIGVLDERGVLYLRGRERDEINKGGMKIFPADVDAVIERHPAVSDVCAFAVQHPLYGEDLAVAVVLQPQAPGIAAVHAWTLQELGAHRLPSQWYALDEIPRTSRGKINRASVAALCATRVPVPAGILSGTRDE